MLVLKCLFSILWCQFLLFSGYCWCSISFKWSSTITLQCLHCWMKNQKSVIYTASCHSKLKAFIHLWNTFFNESWEIYVSSLKVHSPKMFSLLNVHKEIIQEVKQNLIGSCTSTVQSTSHLPCFISEFIGQWGKGFKHQK